jgi:hypothetical protein
VARSFNIINLINSHIENGECFAWYKKNILHDVDISEYKMHFIILCVGITAVDECAAGCAWKIGVRSGLCCVLRPSNTEKDLSSVPRARSISLSSMHEANLSWG